MALFIGLFITNQILWITCSPITTNLQKVVSLYGPFSQTVKIYGLDQLSINLSSLILMVVYIPASIPGNYFLDEYGTKKGVIEDLLFQIITTQMQLALAATVILVGAWVRLLADTSFTFVLLGQFLAALGTPLIVSSPQKISAFWNVPEKVQGLMIPAKFILLFIRELCSRRF